tara:strand:+ start:954 stop:1646 length:693 start_codon:yes stop_codon:yes gene_type:complete
MEPITKETSTSISSIQKNIAKDGQYTGPSKWPEHLAQLKNHMNRLLFSVGSGGNHQNFLHIHSLIKKHGTKENSILYQNFNALRQAIPAIDGIDLDNEHLYSEPGQKTIVELSRMLHRLGYKVTFCPFEKPDFWVHCLHELHSEVPGLVTGFHTQHYDSSYPKPKVWIQAIQNKMGHDFDVEGFVLPGLRSRGGNDCSKGLCPDGSKNIKAKFKKWKEDDSNDNIQGGFI